MSCTARYADGLRDEGVDVLDIAAAHGLAGLWTDDVWTLFLLSIPGVVLAMLLGWQLARRMDPSAFDRYLSLALVVLGVLVLVG